ncbi:MAG: hypothetical protein Q8P61_08635 [Candidatus Nanopelagicales bacterium]|nr:hypothetical protein [Candidatus Nanopelagicales bacterium]
MAYPVAELAVALATSDTSDYVRLVADWLAHGDLDDSEPTPTGLPVPDALVAAAVAYRCTRTGDRAPAWTSRPDRCLGTFWHPGDDRLFAYSLAHAPTDFLVRGVVVEQDSLVSV